MDFKWLFCLGVSFALGASAFAQSGGAGAGVGTGPSATNAGVTGAGSSNGSYGASSSVGGERRLDSGLYTGTDRLQKPALLAKHKSKKGKKKHGKRSRSSSNDPMTSGTGGQTESGNGGTGP